MVAIYLQLQAYQLSKFVQKYCFLLLSATLNEVKIAFFLQLAEMHIYLTEKQIKQNVRGINMQIRQLDIRPDSHLQNCL